MSSPLQSLRVPTRRDSESMRCILATGDGAITFPKTTKYPFPEFIPKQREMTARQTKLVSLYGDKGEIFISNQMKDSNKIKDHGPLAYPLTKMSDCHVNEETKKPRRAFTDEVPRIPPSEYMREGGFSSKEIKQLYDLRSRLTLPFPSNGTGDEKMIIDGNKFPVQEAYNRQLAELRQRQPVYSDIFGMSNLSSSFSKDNPTTVNPPFTAVPNRSLREVHEEIQPSGANPIYRARHEQVEETARERYVKEFNEHGNHQEKNQEEQPKQTQSKSIGKETQLMSPKNSQLSLSFNQDTTKESTGAKVFMMRVWNIPQWLSEEELVNHIRRCHCHVTKIWLPSDIILGQHKGVGSIVIRESWRPDRQGKPQSAKADTLEMFSTENLIYKPDASALDVLFPKCSEAMNACADVKNTQTKEDLPQNNIVMKREEMSFKDVKETKSEECDSPQIDEEEEPLKQLLRWFDSVMIKAYVEELMTES